MTPFSFQFPLADFDLTRLPVDPDLLRGDASMLASAVQEFYRDSFQKLGGSATVLVGNGVVSVAWQPESGDASAQLLQHAVNLLRKGNASGAEPILRALLAQDARNADALYNLGMMLSDQGRLAEAVETLQESLNFHPAHSEGWTALGVAQARLNAIPEAVKALERAIEIDPSNAHALRNLAAIHAKESPSRALPFMQEAALHGEGAPKDEAEAAKWYCKAAEQGDWVAQGSLASCYANGQGVSKDDVEAVKWYRKAAEQGSLSALFRLGNCYERGQGVPKEDVEAYAHYNLAGIRLEKARNAREKIAKSMSLAQIATAQKRTKYLQRLYTQPVNVCVAK